MRSLISPSFTALLLTTLLGVFCATGAVESEVEGEVSVELEEVLIYRDDVVVDKSVRHSRPSFTLQFFSKSPSSISVPLTFNSERSDFNGLGAPMLT